MLSFCLLPCCQLLLPVSCSASSFSEAMRMGAEVYHNLKNLIKEKYGEGLLC
jgi:enolase